MFLGRILGAISEEDPPPEVVSDPCSSITLMHPSVGELEESYVAYERLHQIPKFSPKDSRRVSSTCNFQGFPHVCPCDASQILFFFFLSDNLLNKHVPTLDLTEGVLKVLL